MAAVLPQKWVRLRFFLLVVLLSFSTIEANDVEEGERYRQAAIRVFSEIIVELRGEPQTPENLAEIAEACFFLGELSKLDDTKLEFYRRGRDAVDELRRRRPTDKGALLWWAVNSLGELRVRRPFSALWRLRGIRDELETLKELDETFEYAAADRVLAKLYAEAPGVLLGSNPKAEHHFREALRIAPNFPANTILFAGFLVELGRTEEAQVLLSEMEAGHAFQKFPLYASLWQLELIEIRKRLSEPER